MSAEALAPLLPLGGARTEPTRGWVLANVALLQAGWFACVLGAARGWPWFGTVSAAAILAWHLWRAPSPGAEARLIAAVLLLGALVDGAVLATGAVAYASGQWWPLLTPHWMLALWALFAASLNVSLRWLKGRWLLAALLGAVAGPLSYAAGVRLGAASFVDARVALGALALAWLIALPALVALGQRHDGVGGTAAAEGGRG